MTSHPKIKCQCGCGEQFTPSKSTQIYKNAKHCRRVMHRKQGKLNKSPFFYKEFGQYKNNPIFGKSLFLPTEYRGLNHAESAK